MHLYFTTFLAKKQGSGYTAPCKMSTAVGQKHRHGRLFSKRRNDRLSSSVTRCSFLHQKPDLPLARLRRRHELPDSIEHNFQLGVQLHNSNDETKALRSAHGLYI